jgi:hypothetical protein
MSEAELLNRLEECEPRVKWRVQNILESGWRDNIYISWEYRFVNHDYGGASGFAKSHLKDRTKSLAIVENMVTKAGEIINALNAGEPIPEG